MFYPVEGISSWGVGDWITVVLGIATPIGGGWFALEKWKVSKQRQFLQDVINLVKTVTKDGQNACEQQMKSFGDRVADGYRAMATSMDDLKDEVVELRKAYDTSRRAKRKGVDDD